VFAGLSFALKPGGALLLKGSNGSGKSTLLRIMAGLLQPIVGNIQWHDGPIVDEPDIHHQRLHYVGHHDAVKPMLSVYENIAFWAALRQTDEHVADALDAFDISHLAQVPGRFLSAGQKRRLNLARILAAPAKLWLLDEPTTALDVATVSRFEQVLFRHRKNGGMVIASTHTTLGLDGTDTLRLDDFKAKQVFDETLY